MHRHLHLPLLQKEPGLFALLVTHVVHIQKQTHTQTQAHTCRLPGIVQASSYIVPHPLFNSIFWPKRTFHDGSGSGNGNGSGSSSRSSFLVPSSPLPLSLPLDCSFGCANSFWCCPAAASASRRPSIHLKCNSKIFSTTPETQTDHSAPFAHSHPVRHAACQKVHFRQRQRPLCNDSIASGPSPGRSPSWRAHI